MNSRNVLHCSCVLFVVGRWNNGNLSEWNLKKSFARWGLPNPVSRCYIGDRFLHIWRKESRHGAYISYDFGISRIISLRRERLVVWSLPRFPVRQVFHGLPDYPALPQCFRHCNYHHNGKTCTLNLYYYIIQIKCTQLCQSGWYYCIQSICFLFLF